MLGRAKAPWVQADLFSKPTHKWRRANYYSHLGRILGVRRQARCPLITVPPRLLHSFGVQQRPQNFSPPSSGTSTFSVQGYMTMLVSSSCDPSHERQHERVSMASSSRCGTSSHCALVTSAGSGDPSASADKISSMSWWRGGKAHAYTHGCSSSSAPCGAACPTHRKTPPSQFLKQAGRPHTRPSTLAAA